MTCQIKRTDLADLLVGQLSLDEGSVAVDRSLLLLFPSGSSGRLGRSSLDVGSSTRLASGWSSQTSTATDHDLRPSGTILGIRRRATLAAGRAGLARRAGFGRGAGLGASGTFLGHGARLGAARAFLRGRAGLGAAGAFLGGTAGLGAGTTLLGGRAGPGARSGLAR